MTPPTLHTDRITLRPVTSEDLPRLVEIVHEPSVALWWDRTDDQLTQGDLLPDDGQGFVIESDGDLAGWIGYAEEPDRDYRHASIDLFIGTEWQGKGLGTGALRTLSRYLFEERGHHRITIDPALENKRAIHVYESVGFRPVGVMRAYECRDGGWGDNLLLDMLREDFEGTE